MKRSWSVWLALLGILFPFAASASEDASDLTALVQRAFDRTLHAPGVRSLELRIHRGGRLVSRRAFDLAYRRAADGAQSLLRFTAPTYLRGHALLVLGTPGGTSDTWLYQAEERRPRRVGVTHKADAFYGSDLSFEELEHQQLRSLVAAPARRRRRVALRASSSRPRRDGNRSTGGSSCGWIARGRRSRAWTSTVARTGSRTSGCAYRSTTPEKRMGSSASHTWRIEQVGRDAWTDVETARMTVEPAIPAAVFSASVLERESEDLYATRDAARRSGAGTVSDRWRRRALYGACNEDSRTEIVALAPTSSDTVVCVAAGGGRALALLGAGPRRLIAVDRRESQLHALELKAAALDAFAFERFRAFLGVSPDTDRLDAYAALRTSLSPRARRYWDPRRGLVRNGVLYAGRLETTLARFAALLRRAGLMRWPDAAFAATSLAEQRAVLARSAVEVVRGRACWRWLFHPIGVALALQDPSFLRSTEGRVGSYLYGRMLDFASRRLLRESFLLHLIYFGRYDPDGALPRWLQPEGAERARKHLDRLELRCATLAAIAPRVAQTAPLCWSLSDVSAWMRRGAFPGAARTTRVGESNGVTPVLAASRGAVADSRADAPRARRRACARGRSRRTPPSSTGSDSRTSCSFRRCPRARRSASPTARSAAGCCARRGSHRSC